MSPRALILLLMLPMGPALGQWIRTNWPASNGSAIYLFASDSSLYALNGSRVYCSTDEGDHWTSLVPDGSGFLSGVAIVSGPYLLIGGTSGVYRTSDNGLHWESSSAGLRDDCYQYPPHADTAVHTFFLKDSFLFVGTRKGAYRSTDHGSRWWCCSNGMVGQSTFAFLADGDTLLASGYPGGMFRTTNNGYYWTLLAADYEGYASKLISNGRAIFRGTMSNGVCRSTDHGFTWTPVNKGIWTPWVHGLAVHDSLLFAVTEGGGIFVTTNDGDTWTRINLGMWNGYSVCVKNHTVFVGLDSSVWRGPAVPVTSVEDPGAPGLAQAFRLQNAYPNPFNPSTTISYELPQRLHVTITVFNALGQKVATLVEGEQEAGYHDVKFDGRGLSSGVYFYRLNARPFRGREAGVYVATKKVLVLK